MASRRWRGSQSTAGSRAVRDGIAFGLEPGGELSIEATICNEIRASGRLVVIDDVAHDPLFCRHPTPERYGFQSYISVPITLRDGRFFGTLCAIDPKPARLNTPETIGMFTLFADLIAFHLDARTQLTKLEALVERRTQTLRLLAERLERVRENERTALARELHDEFGQALTALKIDLSAMRNAFGPVAGRTAQRRRILIDSMEGVVDSALDSIERIVCELRPAVLDTLGCAAAAEWLVTQFRQRTQLHVHFKGDHDMAPSVESGTAVFRILQEALTNISRHAEASSVAVELLTEGRELVLCITDDGVGITSSDHEKPTAFGLKGMAERVRALNGTLTPEDQFALRAVKAGAAGYLTKRSAPDQLVDTIRCVLKGGVHLSLATGRSLVNEVMRPEPRRRAGWELLSDRELEILQLIASGMSATGIARSWESASKP